MKRKLISIICAVTLIMSLVAPIAFATEKTTSAITPSSAQATFSFSLQKGADSSSSAAAYKDDYSAAEVYPQDGTISRDNQVAFRVRNDDLSAATGLYVQYDLTTFGMYYYSGSGTPGDKYLYANAPSTNLDNLVSIYGVWYP